MAIQTTNIVAATETVTYTSSGDTALTFMSLCNYDTIDVVVDIHVIPLGGAAAVTNLLIKEITIVPGDTYIIYQGNEKS